jgi:hypothetical protein
MPFSTTGSKKNGTKAFMAEPKDTNYMTKSHHCLTLPYINKKNMEYRHHKKGAPQPSTRLQETEQRNKDLLALLYSLNTPSLDNTYLFDSGLECICIDTGTSASLSAEKENFVQLIPITNLEISGIGSGLFVEGIGILQWSIKDDMGQVIDLFRKDALYIPTAPIGLLCPQQIAQQTKTPNDGFHAIADHGIFQFQGFCKTVKYETRTRLPKFHTRGIGILPITELVALNASKEHTLSKNQRLRLKWHNRLSHLSFTKIQDMARQGKLPKKFQTVIIPYVSAATLEKLIVDLYPMQTKPDPSMLKTYYQETEPP